MVLIYLIFALIIYISYLYFTKIYFLRSPVRLIPQGKNIVAPANGKIVAITNIDKNLDNLKIRKGLIGKIKTLTHFLKKDGIMISIMMNVHNVHVQRSPVTGVIKSIKHNPGKFLNAVKDADKLEWLVNENIETIIENKYLGKIKVIQIAGFLARRCESYLKINQKIIKGQHIGVIKLGSQVTLIIPRLKLNVKLGQNVIEGETILAEYK